jgi:hypothetical protein
MADISTLPTIDVVGAVPVSQRRSFIRVIELAFRNRAGNISKILDNGDLQSNQDKFVFINGNALVGSVPTFNSPNQEDTGDQLRVEFEFNKALDHS